MVRKRSRGKEPEESNRKIRYAVVGLGYFAQNAVLPAFAHARKNSELAALVSDDREKLEALGRKYGVERLFSYEEYRDCLGSGAIDAAYIALPNHLHREYTVGAAEAGVHVLCEKPMAVTEHECQEMIDAAAEHDVRLMIAYRLHFEEANLKAVELVKSGKLGDPRIFSSVFTMKVEDEDNIRLNPLEMGGGTLYDIGVYCINAARYLFRDEPVEVAAMSANNGEKRFRGLDEMTTAVLRFPGERLATFTSSFGAASHASYRIVGTEGDLEVTSAYEYAEAMKHVQTVGGKKTQKTFPRRDQVAPEILRFSECVLEKREPEPSGREGLADVRIIRALYRSAAEGRALGLPPYEKRTRPGLEQEIRRPPVEEPELIHVEGPGEE